MIATPTPMPLRTAQRLARWLAVGVMACSGTALGAPLDLAAAWRMALNYDPAFQAAISEQAAAETLRRQGRAGLLPQVRASYSHSRITGGTRQPDGRGGLRHGSVRHQSSNAYLELQQTVLDYGRFAEYRYGQARADLGRAVFQFRQQEAGVRLASAYLDVLRAQEIVALQASLAASLDTHAQAQQSLAKRGEGTLTDVQETQARLEVMRARLVRSRQDLAVARRALQSLLGQDHATLAGLRAAFPLTPPEPAALGAWLERVRVNNPDVRAAQEAVRVAKAEIDQATGRHLPTLHLLASVGKADSENLSLLSQRSNTFSIGLNVRIPLFAGGYDTANSARARLEHNRREHELRAALERAQAEATRRHAGVMGGVRRIQALETAVATAKLALDGMRKAATVGHESNLTVLRAQDRYYQAQGDLMVARVNYLLDRLALLAVAGELQSSHFDDISQRYLGPAVKLDEATPG